MLTSTQAISAMLTAAAPTYDIVVNAKPEQNITFPAIVIHLYENYNLGFWGAKGEVKCDVVSLYDATLDTNDELNCLSLNLIAHADRIQTITTALRNLPRQTGYLASYKIRFGDEPVGEGVEAEIRFVYGSFVIEFGLED